MYPRLFLFLITFFTLSSAHQPTGADPVAGEFLIKLRAGTDFHALLKTSHTLGPEIADYRLLSAAEGVYWIKLRGKHTTTSLLRQRLRAEPSVLLARENQWLDTRSIPNDPHYGEQWNLDLIQLPAVWDITTGGTTADGDVIVAAIVDTGFNIEHEDLEENVWQHPFEIPDNGEDDDNNGYIDDVNGWNFANNSAKHARSSHGHRVTAILGARGDNGTGIAGVNWQVRLLPLTISNEAHAIEAFEYLIAMRKRYNETQGSEGAFIVVNNNSWGFAQRFCEEDMIWRNLHDRMGQVGILTAGATTNDDTNVDLSGDIPSTCDSDYLITMLNSNAADQKHSRTGYSSTSIDLAAPGENSASLGLQSDFQRFTGTSAAAPHVAGTIALLYSLPCPGLAKDALRQPAETALRIKKAILDGVDPIASMEQYTVTGGRLNALRATEALQASCGNQPADFGITRLFPNPADASVTLVFTAPDFERSYPLEVYNMLGQLMHRDQVSPARFGTIQYSFAVDRWAPGTYVIVFGEGTTRLTRKVVVY